MKRVAPGIYRNPIGGFYQRLTLNGRRTWRTLHSLTLKDATIEAATKVSDHHRAKLGLARDPFAHVAHVADVLQAYERANFPTPQGRSRSERTTEQERKRIPRLTQAFGRLKVDQVTPQTLIRYGAQRTAKRAAELELHTLRNAFRYAHASGLVQVNPIEKTPRLTDGKGTRHCREHACESADELHFLARKLLASPRTAPFGWQMLLECFTGCRTSEILELEMSPAPKGPGYVDKRWLWLTRKKDGINPFVLLHDPLRQCIEAHHRWHAKHYKGHPHWIPHPWDRRAHASPTGLTGALTRLCRREGVGHRTSHGCRAFFVAVRRSQGASDEQIAAEIGDATGATIIAATYGPVPPNWQGGEALDWLPRNGPAAWA